MSRKKELVNRIMASVAASSIDNRDDIDAIIDDWAVDRPYTMVRISAKDHITEKKYFACCFSKVSWPDTYDRDEGIRIATRKAAKRIATQILADRL